MSRSLQSNAKLRPFYLTTAGGQIRAWRVGMGPDVVILAGLALAAAVTAERAAVACPGFRITALELPGIGGSADHDADEAGAISAALAEAIGIAGVEGCVLVGCDLAGALVPQVAAQLAVAPVAAVSLGGERAKAWNRSGINPPDLAPRTDGTLLTALWSFLRDRHVLRADDPTQPAPSGEPIPTPSELDATLVAAAVRPVRFARLWSELCRVSNDLEPAADLQGFAELATMLSPTLDAAMAEPSGTKPLSGDRIWHHEVETPRGRMHLRRVGGEGRPLLVLPTGGGSSAQFAPVLRGLAAGRQTFSVDYLGNGLSAKPHRSTVTIDDLAEDMAALIDALGFREVDVWGSHTGAIVGLELALRHPVKVGRLVMEGPVFVSPDFQTDLLERYFPPIAPDGWGRHLQLVWNWRRDMFLFWPWYRVERAAARQLGLPSPHHLHDYTIGILESGPTYDGAYRAAFSYDTAARLPGLTRPALVTAGPNDMLVNALAETRALNLQNVEVRETPTTIWWPDPDPEAAAATLAIYDAFLRG